MCYIFQQRSLFCCCFIPNIKKNLIWKGSSLQLVLFKQRRVCGYFFQHGKPIFYFFFFQHGIGEPFSTRTTLFLGLSPKFVWCRNPTFSLRFEANDQKHWERRFGGFITDEVFKGRTWKEETLPDCYAFWRRPTNLTTPGKFHVLQ